MTYTNGPSPDRHPREKSLAASFPPAAGTLICVSQHFDTMPLPAARDAVAPDGRQQTVALEPGTCVSIPAGTHFQFRSSGPGPLAIVGVTMPPWPGDDEARELPGAWPANASAPPA